MKSDSSKQAWHMLSADACARQQQSNLSQGLSAGDVQKRVQVFGYNELVEGKKRSLLKIFSQQFSDFMILVLVAAALISGAVGEPSDAIAIMVIIVLNAIIGAVQEYRAEHAIAALKLLATQEALVIRDGVEQVIAAKDLVPGDIVLLEAGNIVPADLRLFKSESLEVDEAALTGESLAVGKSIEALIEQNIILADRYNIAHKSTLVTRGRASGLVIATGMETEIGKIAAVLGEQQTVKTPLQKRLAVFGQRLALVILLICVLIFVAGIMRDEPVLLMFLTAVSLAVAAIPEALPAVITVSLAIGARKMSQHSALVRNLPAVETLGSVTYICTDKTGTLTQNKMQLEQFFVEQQSFTEISAEQKQQKHWDLIGKTLALNNDIIMSNGVEAQGEPTELALHFAAQINGFDKAHLEQQYPRVAELPFDSERKCMTTLHKRESDFIALVKGAPETVLPLCTFQLDSNGEKPIELDGLMQQAEKLAGQGYRVLALACRELLEKPAEVNSAVLETQLSFLCLLALLDPPREEARKAVAECVTAGIIPVMITGDHPGTALAIAKRLGIATQDSVVITGVELAAMSMVEFENRVANIRVYARVNPEQKTKIVQALQDKNQFVAMTGDGVNDAPALKKANIGIAMGKQGTDVAREAADMILLDNNFATIVAAVREGRRIFDNIRKFIKYTMTSNSGEILTLFLAPFLGLPIPLLPIHILWINLVTDGLPGLALSMEPAEKGIMQRPPRLPDESIFAGGMWQHMLGVGFLIAGLSIFSQAWAISIGSTNWQTIVFTVLTFSQLVHSLVIRSESQSLFSLGLLSNKSLLGAVLLTVMLQMAVIYVPFFNDIFKTQPLAWDELLMCFSLPLIVLLAVETEKYFVRKRTVSQIALENH